MDNQNDIEIAAEKPVKERSRIEALSALHKYQSERLLEEALIVQQLLNAEKAKKLNLITDSVRRRP